MSIFYNAGNGFQSVFLVALRHIRNFPFQVCKAEVLSAVRADERQAILAHLGNDITFQRS